MGADDAGAAVARRRLGRLLTELREGASDADGRPITVEQAAGYIERARPTLYRMEHGLPGVRIKNHDINALCDLYRASDDDRRILLGLATVTRVRGWFHPFTDILPPNFDLYIGLEEAAQSIDAYESDRVHGLLQTEQYAREMLRIPGFDGRQRDDAEIERRIQVRLRRQQILTREEPEPAQLEVILGEAVLRRPVAGAAVMAQQLQHINELSELPNVTVRVVPLAAGLHQGVVSGPFAILRFADNHEPPTVYMDNFVGHLLLSKEAQIARFDAAITGIRGAALDPPASQDLITRTAKELHRA